MPCAPVSSVRRRAAPAPYGFHDTAFSRCTPGALHFSKGACAVTMRRRLLFSGAGALQNMPKRRGPRQNMCILHFFCRRAALRPLKKRAPRTWGKVRPRAKPRACVSPGRTYCRQASQEALNALSSASLALPLVNGGSSHCVLYLFGIESPIPLRPGLAAKAFLLFPEQPRGGVSLRQKPPRQPCGCRGGGSALMRPSPPGPFYARPGRPPALAARFLTCS